MEQAKTFIIKLLLFCAVFYMYCLIYYSGKKIKTYIYKFDTFMPNWFNDGATAVFNFTPNLFLILVLSAITIVIGLFVKDLVLNLIYLILVCLFNFFIHNSLSQYKYESVMLLDSTFFKIEKVLTEADYKEWLNELVEKYSPGDKYEPSKQWVINHTEHLRCDNINTLKYEFGELIRQYSNEKKNFELQELSLKQNDMISLATRSTELQNPSSVKIVVANQSSNAETGVGLFGWMSQNIGLTITIGIGIGVTAVGIYYLLNTNSEIIKSVKATLSSIKKTRQQAADLAENTSNLSLETANLADNTQKVTVLTSQLVNDCKEEFNKNQELTKGVVEVIKQVSEVSSDTQKALIAEAKTNLLEVQSLKLSYYENMSSLVKIFKEQIEGSTSVMIAGFEILKDKCDLLDKKLDFALKKIKSLTNYLVSEQEVQNTNISTLAESFLSMKKKMGIIDTLDLEKAKQAFKLPQIVSKENTGLSSSLSQTDIEKVRGIRLSNVSLTSSSTSTSTSLELNQFNNE